MKNIKVIITGASGMVGEGVLHECLQHRHVKSVLVVGRKPCGTVHAKLKEIIIPDLTDISTIQKQLLGYDACFFCAGVSSVGKKEEEYYKLTYTLTIDFATAVSKINKDLIFEYVSGAGTKTSEKGSMWARVKGKTENDLLKLPFKSVYNIRPGFMYPTKGLKNVQPYYKYFLWMFPVLKAVYPKGVSTLAAVAKGMINAALYGTDKTVLEVKDLVRLSERY